MHPAPPTLPPGALDRIRAAASAVGAAFSRLADREVRSERALALAAEVTR